METLTKRLEVLRDEITAEIERDDSAISDPAYVASWRDELNAILSEGAAQDGELREALRVIFATVRGDEKSECWTIRRYLDERDVYHGDLNSAERLIKSACELALAGIAHPKLGNKKSPQSDYAKRLLLNEPAESDMLWNLQHYIRHNAVSPSDHVGAGQVVALSILLGWIGRERQRINAAPRGRL